MKKYKKVTDMEVLKKFYEVLNDWHRKGWWQNYITVREMASFLGTSQYQVTKAYKNLKEKSFLKIIKEPTYSEEYDNGLYTESCSILFTQVYTITDEGRKEVENES